MMKLDNLNKNNINLGLGRTVHGDSFEYAVPTSIDQSVEIDIDNEQDDDKDNEQDNNNQVDIDKTIDLIQMSNSWAPFRRVSDIRKVPNTANLL